MSPVDHQFTRLDLSNIHNFSTGIKMGFDQSLKARNAELGGVGRCLLNEPQVKHPLPRGVWGSPNQSFFGFWDGK